jgi:hypothetical protein
VLLEAMTKRTGGSVITGRRASRTLSRQVPRFKGTGSIVGKRAFNRELSAWECDTSPARGASMQDIDIDADLASDDVDQFQQRGTSAECQVGGPRGDTSDESLPDGVDDSAHIGEVTALSAVSVDGQVLSAQCASTKTGITAAYTWPAR